MAGIDFRITCVYFNFSELKLDIFKHDGMIDVVVEEKNVIKMLVAVHFVRNILFVFIHLYNLLQIIVIDSIIDQL